jgi:hypothetical protein
MAYSRFQTRRKRFQPKGPSPVFVKPKGAVPRAIEPYRDAVASPQSVHSTEELRRIYRAWEGYPVEIYGKVIRGYGTEAPYGTDHIPCRLAGTQAFSVLGLDEFETEADLGKLPSRPIGR